MSEALGHTIGVLLSHAVGIGFGLCMPAAFWRKDTFWSRMRSWEREGRTYERLFRVSLWKDALPDGGAWLRQFPKSRLRSTDPSYLWHYVYEQRKGECVHTIPFLFVPFFALWSSSWSIFFVIFLYTIVVHVPCIVVLRYNRARLMRVLRRTQKKHNNRQHVDNHDILDTVHNFPKG
jgi:glycosyl-4,4'-diaponeurosporenoate acyltransferase